MVLADQAAGSTLARALSKIHGTGLPVLPSECIKLQWTTWKPETLSNRVCALSEVWVFALVVWFVLII